jgi:hypothetical protein
MERAGNRSRLAARRREFSGKWFRLVKPEPSKIRSGSRLNNQKSGTVAIATRGHVDIDFQEIIPFPAIPGDCA